MKAIYEKRFLKLAEHLEQGRPGGHKKFDFSQIHANHGTPKHCGSAGCAMGELPVIYPRLWAFELPSADPEEAKYDFLRVFLKKNGNPRLIWEDVAEFFGVGYEDAVDLFDPGRFRWWAKKGVVLSGKATAKQVAKSIRQYVAAVKSGKTADNY